MGQRGGKRRAAGRKKGSKAVIHAIVETLAYVEKPTAAMILAQIDETGLWKRHLNVELEPVPGSAHRPR